MKILFKLFILSFVSLFALQANAQWSPERTTLNSETRFDIFPLHNIHPQYVDPAGVLGPDSETGRAKGIDFPSPGSGGLFEIRSGDARFSEYDLQSVLASPGGLDPFSGYITENMFRASGFGWVDIAGTFRSPAGIPRGFYYYHPNRDDPSVEQRGIVPTDATHGSRVFYAGGWQGMIWGSFQNSEGQWEAFYFRPGEDTVPQNINKIRVIFPEVSLSEIRFGIGSTTGDRRAMGIGNYELASLPGRSRIFYTFVYEDARNNAVYDLGTFGGIAAKLQEIVTHEVFGSYYLLGNLVNSENHERAFVANLDSIDYRLRASNTHELGTISGRSEESNHAHAISRREIVVGEAQVPGESDTRAFVYTPALGMRDLNQLFRDGHEAESWRLLRATAISDNWYEGILIVGEGIYTPATYHRNMKGHWVREVTGPSVRRSFVMVPSESANSNADVINSFGKWK